MSTLKSRIREDKRVLSEGGKNVHAGLEGFLTRKPSNIEDWQRVSYNPRKDEFFHDEKGNRISGAKVIKLTPKGVFVPMDNKFLEGFEKSAISNKALKPLLERALKTRRSNIKKGIKSPENTYDQISRIKTIMRESPKRSKGMGTMSRHHHPESYAGTDIRNKLSNEKSYLKGLIRKNKD
jgi:hypothetical protein